MAPRCGFSPVALLSVRTAVEKVTSNDVEQHRHAERLFLALIRCVENYCVAK